MTQYLSALVLLLVSVNVLLGLPKLATAFQKSVAADISAGPVISENIQAKKPEVKLPILKNKGLPPPIVSANAVLVKDLKSNTILFSKEENQRLPIASTTKIMTALIASSYFKPDDVLTVPALALVSGSSMGLQVGEKISLRSLLYGLLLNSGNDAAYTLAQDYPGGLLAFVNKMNQKAEELGLTNTHFDNPAGFDSPNHYSSASDLSKIAVFAMDDPYFARIVATKEASVSSTDKTIIHNLKNLNKLLDIPGVIGIKTGTTPKAKENLVALVDKNERIIQTVLLGSDDRFGETEKILDWTLKNFYWE